MQPMITKTVTKIQFGLFSPAEVINLSVVQIRHPEAVEGGVPKPGGLIDLRMGTTDSVYLCGTCNNDSFNCAGHFGHIELCRPVFHPGYVNRIKKVLDTVCFYCSRIRQIKNDVANTKSKIACSVCNNKQPLIKKEGLVLYAYMKGEDTEGKVMLNGERVLSILKKILDEELGKLGFDKDYARPESMLIKNLLVCPPCVRPSIVVEGMLRSEDDLTYKYCDIIKSNANLLRYEEEGAPAHIIRDYEQLVQYHVATLMDNDIAGQPQSLQRNGRPLKALSARLRGKEGRLRGNLMGKRVDFSARSVISPDPNIGLNDLGVPKAIATIHTVPERVTNFNLSRLQSLVDVGPFNFPGANYVVRCDGQRIDLRYTKRLLVEPGFVVERHLSNGDVVLFNRQPSLHKMSMMAHRVRVMPGNTFRLNLSVTTPYGADFDGDEMNMHTPQTLNAVSELREIMDVTKNLVSAQSNRPVMGIVQDSCIGAHLLTKPDVFLDEAEAMGLFYSRMVDDYYVTKTQHPVILRPKRVYSGKQLFSSCLPRINYKKGEIVILNGYLMCGTMDKKILGTAHGSLIHVISNECSCDTTRLFINALQRLLAAFLLVHGFSVGVGDAVCGTSRDSIAAAVNQAAALVHSRITRVAGMTMRQSFESKVTGLLNTARDDYKARKNNNLSNMVQSGSKGSRINISQVSFCVGQQNVEGKRIGFGFKSRTLPHFTCYDYSAISRGFVPESYIEGLTASSFFFHTMGGREGLIDTACKTAETGYIQRRIVKAMEDARVEYDGSVRGSNTLYQYSYGNDLFDASYLESQVVRRTEFNLKDTSERLKQLLFTDEVLRIVEEESVYFGCSDKDYSNISGSKKDDYRDGSKKDGGSISGNRDGGSISGSDKDDYRDGSKKDGGSISGNRDGGSISGIKDGDSISGIKDYSNISSSKKDGGSISGSDKDYSNYKDGGSISGSKKDYSNISGSDKDGSNYKYNSKYNSKHLLLPFNVERLLFNNKSQLADFDPRSLQSTRDGLFEYLMDLHPGSKNIKNKDHPIYYAIFSILNTAALIRYRINEEGIHNIVHLIKKRYARALVPTNEMVGTLAAQSIGEPATQMTLNTFHFAGVAQHITTGVPRLKEIINAAKNISNPFLSMSTTATSLEEASAISSSIEYKCVGDVVSKVSLLYEPYPNISRIDDELVSTYYALHSVPDITDPYVIRLVLNRQALIASSVSVDEVVDVVKKASVECIAGDENDDEIVVRVRSSRNLVNSTAIVLNTIPSLLKRRVKGIENIKKVFILKKGDSYSLHLSGLNMRGCLADGHNVYCNDLHEVFSVLGIEATREVILRELRGVIEADGSYVNLRHLSLLCDVMTLKGLRGITRHGVNKASTGALKRCSFEQTVEILLDAAASAELNRCKGVTENIMLGAFAPIGTGCTSAVLDIKKLKKTQILFSASPANFTIHRGKEFSPYDFKPGLATPQMNSPTYSPRNRLSPTSPVFSPISPIYSVNSPVYSPLSPTYKANSPGYSPLSPRYSPADEDSYSPLSTKFSPASPNYSPLSPKYSPKTANSPGYVPKTDEDSKRQKKD